MSIYRECKCARDAPSLDPAGTLPHGPPLSSTARGFLVERPPPALAGFTALSQHRSGHHPARAAAVHWYGLAYVVGIVFAWWYAKRLVTNQRLWPDGILPMKTAGHRRLRRMGRGRCRAWAGGSVMCLFYDLPRYIANPADILAVWQGGMSFHGGILGTLVAMTLFARSRNIHPWTLFDVVAAGVPVGLGLGRSPTSSIPSFGGASSDVPWAVEFPTGGPFPRHPSQLYEGLLEGLVLFVVLRVLTHSGLKLKTPRIRLRRVCRRLRAIPHSR